MGVRRGLVNLGLDFCYFPVGGGVRLLVLEMLVCIFAYGEAVLVRARKCIFSKFLIIDPLHVIEHGRIVRPMTASLFFETSDEMFVSDFVRTFNAWAGN
jgi:hypothetical protein